jgi:hypothetical protein
MQNREKQIEEMAKICCNTCEFGCGFNGECDLDNDYRKCGISNETAEALYNAGYRKPTDLAEEIFAEIEDLFFDKYLLGNITASLFEDKYAELKKKYIGEDTNVLTNTEWKFDEELHFEPLDLSDAKFVDIEGSEE